jgi:hypothetical protein
MASKSSTNPPPQRLGPHTHLVAGAGGALVTFASLPDTTTLDVGRLTNVVKPGGGMAEVMFWGKDNNLPLYREELIMGNNIVPALIERKRNILCGQGWYAYRERYMDDGAGMMKRVLDEVPMPPDAAAFFLKFKRTSRQLLGEMLKHGIAMPEFLRSLDGKIKQVRSLEMKYMRSGKKNGMGEVETWHWSNFWQKGNLVKSADRVLASVGVYAPEAKKKQDKFVLPICDDLFNDGYYPVPAYWGGRHWITLSNIIPLFHEANLKHGALPRWNVVVPHDYFYDYQKMENASTAEERAALLTESLAREQAFVDDFNEVMSGLGNTGRTLVTKSEMIAALGGKESRILVEPLEVDMGDERLLKLFQASNVANVSAQALHPTLASIETAGKGIGSGTEIRNAFLLYLIIAAPAYRDALLEVVEVVKTENGWPADIHYAIRDAEMTTLAENPAGVQPAETQIGT